MYNILDLSVETAVSGAGAAIGQTLIPVPVLGAIVGSLVSTKVLSLIKSYIFGGGYYELVKRASYEKAYSDEYLSLTAAFDQCSYTVAEAYMRYTCSMNSFKSRRIGEESNGDVDLNQTYDDIVNS